MPRCFSFYLGFLVVLLASDLLYGSAKAIDESSPAALPLRPTPPSRLHPPPALKPGLTIWLSSQGNDTWVGSPEKPFASLERCREEIRALKRKGSLPEGGVLVVIQGGRYPVSATFDLGPEDSGTPSAPVRYTAAPGEKPVFYGGRQIDGWKPLTDEHSYPLLNPQARPHVWTANLANSGIDNLLPLRPGGFGSGNGFVTHPAHELFFNGRAMPLARGPNDGFLRIKAVEIEDGTKGYDRQGSKTGSFYYEGELPRKWVNESDLLLYGYWFWDWADSYERVASIDPDRRLITLKKPWHTYGYSVGAPFYAVNAISELDSPGEWFLDRSAKTILFYPPSDSKSANIEFSVTPGPLLKMENVSDVAFEGITWDLGSGDAVHINGGERCLLAGCTVTRFAGNGIEIHGGYNHGLLSCDIFSMGRGGVVVSAGNRKTLKAGGIFVENCDIHELSRIDHTYTPAILVSGVGNRIAYNRLHDIPSSALRVEGNDMVIEYNEIYNVVSESDDQGAADMWGDPTFRGNIFRFNYWHHIGDWSGKGKKPKCGQAGIRLDDAISGTLIFGNIFEKCGTGSFGAVQINGGKDNILENNLFIDCPRVVTHQKWEPERWKTFVEEKLAQQDIDLALYLRRYPQMGQILQDPNVNRVQANAALRCGIHAESSPQWYEAPAAADDSLNLKGAASVLTLPGMKPIPFGEIGLYSDSWRSSSTLPQTQAPER